MAQGSSMTQRSARDDAPQAGAARAAFGTPPAPARRSAHSLFIGVMKTLLPSFAIGMVLLIFAWPQVNVEEDSFGLGVSELAADYADSLSMLNARFDGYDEQGRPFSVSADEASQPSSIRDIVDLSLPKGDILLNDGTWLALTAKNGQYDRQGKTLDLEGAVNLFHDQGFELRTATAAIDLEVTETTPQPKGATATNQLKEAVVETGAKIRVPPFIEIGQKIRINPASGEYLGKA